MAAQLTHVATGKVFDLQDYNLVGRSSTATVQILDQSVSREHATIRRQGDTYVVHDLGSANGTFVNDFALSSNHSLKNGDRVLFGFAEVRFTQTAITQDYDEDLNGQTQLMTKAGFQVKTTPVTLLVGDLKDYTNLSARLSTEELAKLMQQWYDDCQTILTSRGAHIDKFIGDAVFAYWRGAGLEERQAAVDAARIISTKMASPGAAEGSHIYDCCVGLHVGEVAMGNFSRGNFTALGDAVNVAFRIESLTRKLGKRVLASSNFVLGNLPEAETAKFPPFSDTETEADYKTSSSANKTDLMSVFDPCGWHQLKGVPQMVEIYGLKSSSDA